MKEYYKNELTTIYNGDCLEVMDNMIKEKVNVDFIITSPPYNRIRNDKYKDYNDNKQDYFTFLDNFIGKALDLSKTVFFNIQQTYFNRKDVHKLMGKYNEYLIQNIIWVKQNPQPIPNPGSVLNSYEYILVFSKKHETLKSIFQNTHNVIRSAVYSQNPYKDIHNAVMHPNVAKWLIENFTIHENTILDPFMGTGTTNYYCCELGRKNIGIEISKLYCDTTIKRITTVQGRLDI